MKARLLVNPSSGGGAGGRAVARLRRRLPAGAELVVSRDAADLAAQARRAVGDGVERLIVAGGDGTFHLVLPALARAGCALGVVPVGRGNDLAGSLGVPRDPLAALSLALEGATRRIDLGRAGERPFVLYGGAGFDASVSATAAAQSRRLPGALAYPLATLRTLVRFRPPQARVEWDGGRFEGAVMFVTACSAPRFGGGMRIAPAAAMDDGVLDLVIVRAVSKLALLRVFPRVFRGTHVGHPAITVQRTRRVRLGFEPESLLGCDGEVVGRVGAAPLEILVDPKALRVVAPG